MISALSDRDLLARLVGFDSVSSKSNLPIADFICEYLDHPRIEVFRNLNAERTKVNLILRIAPKAQPTVDRPGLVLSGHLDVVPAVEPDWLSNPFQLRETEDALYARGACDMKGFDALAINTLRDAATRELHAPLVLILTFDEEPGMLGAEHLVNTWKPPFALPRACLVGEPTCFQVVRMHRGHLKLRVIFHGKTAHSGYPHLGLNAIEPAGRVMVALSALNETMKHERHESSKFFPETPYVALNLGRVHGGEAINVVPDRCTLEFGVRLLPDVSPADMTARAKATVESAARGASFNFETIGYSPSLLVDETAPFYRAMCELMNQRETVAVSYATDGGMLQRLNMDCIVWGPGNIEVAHKANEYMPKSDFVKARELLDRIVRLHCE